MKQNSGGGGVVETLMPKFLSASTKICMLREHISFLVKECGLKAMYLNRRNKRRTPAYMARPYEGKVWIPPINTDIDYYTALHEIGHCEADGSPTMFHCEKERELLAWMWAFANAVTPATREVKRFVEDCLATYDVEIKI